MEDTQYEQLIEGVKNEYEQRILALLEQMREVVRYEGYQSEDPYDLSDDEYRWSMIVWRGDRNDELNLIDFTIEVAEAKHYGDKPEDGINFGLNIVRFSGEILGQFTPFNYTTDCWVSASDPNAVEERFVFFESMGMGDIPMLIDVTPTDEEIDNFTQGFIECGLWADLMFEDREEYGAGAEWPEYMDELTPDAREKCRMECKDFLYASLRDVREFCDRMGDFEGDDGSNPSAMARAGHDFWLTKHHHGAGYWDRGLGDLGDRLTKAAQVYGESPNLWVDAYGKVHAE